MAEQAVPGPSKNPSGKHVRSGQRLMAYNTYLAHRNKVTKSASVKLTAQQLGIGETLVRNIVKDMETTGILSSPPKKRTCQTLYDKLDESEKKCIRRHVHSFFLRNELPTCTKAIRDDDSLPTINRTTLWKILKKLGFVWEKWARNNMLMERR